MDASPRKPDPKLISRPPYRTSRRRRTVFALWEALASRRLAAFLLLLVLYFQLFLFRGVRMIEAATPLGSLLRLQLAFTPERFNRALSAYPGGTGPAEESPAVRALVGELAGVDVWFALVVGLLFASVAALLTISAKRRDPGSGLVTVAAVSVLLPFVAVLADWTENLSHVVLLSVVASPDYHAGIGSWLIAIASGAALLKFRLLAIALGLAVLVWRRCRRDAGATAGGGCHQGLADDEPYVGNIECVKDGESGCIGERRAAAVDEIRNDLKSRPAAHWVTSRRADERLARLLDRAEREFGRDYGGDPDDCAVGLAFSGGGIRSATFNLGLVQALSQLGILPFVDYLSSVSGGGFPAACMTSLLSFSGTTGASGRPTFGTTWRRFPFNPDIVAFKRSTDGWGPSTDDGRNIQLDDMRNMGNYLVPRPRPLGRDTLRGVGAVIVGIVYTLTLYVLLLFAVASFIYLTAASLSSNLVLNMVASSGIVGAILHSIQPTANPWWALLPAGVTLLAGVVFSWAAAWLLSRRYSLRANADSWVTTVASEGQSAEEHRDAFYIALFSLGLAVSLELYLGAMLRLDSMFLDRASALLAQVFDEGAVAHRLGAALAPLVSARMEVGHPFWIWMPLLFALGSLIGLVAFRLLGRKYVDSQPVWSSPGFRTITWAAQGIALYGAGLALLFAVLTLPHFYVVSLTEAAESGVADPAKPLALALLSGAVSAALAYVEARRSSFGDRAGKALDATAAVRHALLGLLLVVLLVATVFFFMALIDQAAALVASPLLALNLLVWATAVPLVLFLLVGRLVNLNYISPHYFTRDRIADTFLKTALDPDDGRVEVVRDDRDVMVSQINGDGSSAPYHLVMGTLNLTDSWHLRHKDRRSEPFLFSKCYCGARSTGYVVTSVFGGGMTRYSRAVAISGAAISSAVGHMTFFAQAFVLTMLNLRLGLWIPNPRGYKRDDAVAASCEDLPEDRIRCLADVERTAFWPTYLTDEMKGQFSARRKLVNITDGAHSGDNGGLYPLFERRCRIIIAGDASADNSYAFTDLFRVIRQVKTDLGITVEIDVSSLKPTGAEVGEGGKRMSARHCAVGEIKYPADSAGRPARSGWLIYFKPAVTPTDPARIRQYFETQESFPMPSTADQFFDEFQYEAQRTLGEVTVADTYQDLLLRRFRKDLRYPKGTTTATLADKVLRRRLAEARTVSPSSAVILERRSARQMERAQRQLSGLVGKVGQQLQGVDSQLGPAVVPPTDEEILEALHPGAMALAREAIKLTSREGDWSWEDLPWPEFFKAIDNLSAALLGQKAAQDRVGRELGRVVASDLKSELRRIDLESMREHGVDFLWLGEFPFHEGVMDDLRAETTAATAPEAWASRA